MTGRADGRFGWAGLRRAVWAAGAVLALVLAGCGLSTSDEPKPIAEDNVPPDLQGTDPLPDQSLPLGEDEVAGTIWFLQDDGTVLYPAQRPVASPVTASRLLGALLGAVTTLEENQEGITTAIPAGTSLVTPPEEQGGVLSVNLPDSFFRLQGDSGRNAAAQVVFTASGIPGVEAVQFLLDGQVQDVFDGSNQARGDPVGRCDYANMANVESC